jgi:hypothetical protein
LWNSPGISSRRWKKFSGFSKKPEYSVEAVPKLQFLEQLLTQAGSIEPKVRTNRVLELARSVFAVDFALESGRIRRFGV